MKKTAKTKVMSVYPLAAALLAAEELKDMGPSRIWRPVNERQYAFLKHFDHCREETGSIREISSVASWSAREINTFLQEQGYIANLRDFKSLEFGIASILDLLLKWSVPGRKEEILEFGTGNRYPGVMINEGVDFYEADEHPRPIAGIKTETNDVVCLTIADSEPSDEFVLMDAVNSIRVKQKKTWAYDRVHFPMIDLDQKVDISWMADMCTMGQNQQPAWIVQPFMEAVAKMNEVGIRVKIVAGSSMRLMAVAPPPPKIMVIDRPFFLWIERPGLKYPLACMYITQDNWKDPKNLE